MFTKDKQIRDGSAILKLPHHPRVNPLAFEDPSSKLNAANNRIAKVT